MEIQGRILHIPSQGPIYLIYVSALLTWTFALVMLQSAQMPVLALSSNHPVPGDQYLYLYIHIRVRIGHSKIHSAIALTFTFLPSLAFHSDLPNLHSNGKKNKTTSVKQWLMSTEVSKARMAKVFGGNSSF